MSRLSCGLAVLLLACIFTAQATADFFTIPEEVLLSAEFGAKAWGPATVTRTDVPGHGVQFSYSGLMDSGTGIKDDWSVQTLYGQILPSHCNGDFSNFDGYSLWVENVGTTTVSVSVFMNTGYTGPSGTPTNTPANDTFWQSAWQTMLPGEAFVITLDFDDAVPWNIADNPSPHTQGSNGVSTAINLFDRKEVSAIGFEVTGSGSGAILVNAVPEPVSVVLGVVGMSTAAALLRHRRERSGVRE